MHIRSGGWRRCGAEVLLNGGTRCLACPCLKITIAESETPSKLQLPHDTLTRPTYCWITRSATKSGRAIGAPATYPEDIHDINRLLAGYQYCCLPRAQIRGNNYILYKTPICSTYCGIHTSNVQPRPGSRSSRKLSATSSAQRWLWETATTATSSPAFARSRYKNGWLRRSASSRLWSPSTWRPAPAGKRPPGWRWRWKPC